MADEKRLIDLDKAFEAINQEVWWTESEKAYFRSFLAKQPKAVAVNVKQYEALREQYHELREKLIELIHKAFQPCEMYRAMIIADHLIANGVTIPVRCKDCVSYQETMGKDSGKPCGYGSCFNPCAIITGIVYDEDFCSYGERRTNA